MPRKAHIRGGRAISNPRTGSISHHSARLSTGASTSQPKVTSTLSPSESPNPTQPHTALASTREPLPYHQRQPYPHDMVQSIDAVPMELPSPRPVQTRPSHTSSPSVSPPPVHFEQPAVDLRPLPSPNRPSKRKANPSSSLPPKPPVQLKSYTEQRSNFRPAQCASSRPPPSPVGSTASMPVGPPPFQRSKGFWEGAHEPASDTLSEVGTRITRRRRIPLHVRTTHPDGKSFSLEQVAAQIEAWRAEIARPAKRPATISREDVTQQISKWRNASRAHSTAS